MNLQQVRLQTHDDLDLKVCVLAQVGDQVLAHRLGSIQPSFGSLQ